ncbi:hypothetical protein SAMN05421780_106176 [Flexibacter flexilis DSM 6793]|uniref:Uncharacterized protein n=1 Tax=Flexibacter flexilis DSM 6793 TaxID=927664 RepID=A0A1I1K0D9_9BACT|nr:hypothetical protein SAMN05421780_106176 [Flexibacter flexilis DSM 6793]
MLKSKKPLGLGIFVVSNLLKMNAICVKLLTEIINIFSNKKGCLPERSSLFCIKQFLKL